MSTSLKSSFTDSSMCTMACLGRVGCRTGRGGRGCSGRAGAMECDARIRIVAHRWIDAGCRLADPPCLRACVIRPVSLLREKRMCKGVAWNQHRVCVVVSAMQAPKSTIGAILCAAVRTMQLLRFRANPSAWLAAGSESWSAKEHGPRTALHARMCLLGGDGMSEGPVVPRSQQRLGSRGQHHPHRWTATIAWLSRPLPPLTFLWVISPGQRER